MAATGDSLAADSAVSESIPVFYGIPEIVSQNHTTELDRSLYQKTEIVPEDYDLRTTDVFLRTPFALSDPRHQLHLLAVHDPTILINNHKIEDPILGQADFALFPVQLFERTSLYEVHSGEHATAVNFISKTNHYERPFSFIRFTTLGDDNMYNIDFTRAFSTKTGFYFSGLYSNSYMPGDSMHSRTNAYYADLYQNTFLPKRLDIFYVSNDHGAARSTELFDIDFVVGNNNDNFCMYYTNYSMDVLFLLPDTTTNNTLSVLGLNTRSTKVFRGLELGYGVDGAVRTLNSAIYGDSQYVAANLWQKCSGSWGRFLCGYAQSIHFSDLLDAIRMDFKPQASIGMRVLDSLFLIYSLSYDIIEPTIVQRSGTCGVPLLPYSLNGNPALRNEKMLRHQASLREDNLDLCFYTAASSDFIFLQEDSTGFYHPENRDTWSVSGFEDHLTVPLPWNFSIGHAGSYVLTGHSLARLPKTIHNALFSWTRSTERSRLTMVFKTSYIGERVSFSQQDLQPFHIISAACTLKFVTLAFSAVFDNILGESSADYPNLSRNFSLSVKWEFWD